MLWPIHAEGYSTTEIAKRIGISLSSVHLLLDYFVSELSDRARQEAKQHPLFREALFGRIRVNG